MQRWTHLSPYAEFTLTGGGNQMKVKQHALKEFLSEILNCKGCSENAL